MTTGLHENRMGINPVAMMNFGIKGGLCLIIALALHGGWRQRPK